MAGAAEWILREFDTIAVVGISRDPEKAAHCVPAAMRSANFRILPVNPVAAPGSILLGERVVPDLDELVAAGEPVEVVNVFRPAAEAPAIAAAAVRIGARALWLQEGIVSAQARAIAEEAGLAYVEDMCLAVVRAGHGIDKAGT